MRSDLNDEQERVGMCSELGIRWWSDELELLWIVVSELPTRKS